MKNILSSVFILIFLLAGCKKHDDTQSSSRAHEFKGIAVINDIGQILGTWGTEDGDWGTDANWSPGEYELLNFPDTVSLDGTFVRDTTGWDSGPGIHEQPRNFTIVFPNPVQSHATLAFSGLGMLKFKATIVDKYYNRMKTYVTKTDGVYRMYYSFSAKDSLNFYKGHGDILVCRMANYADCESIVP
jgi:hypothetical protein